MFFPFTSAFTVELDDEEFGESRQTCGTTGAGSTSVDEPPTRFVRDRFMIGLISCRSRDGLLIGDVIPGDCEDIDVGVVSRLYAPGPGDPEYRVEGLAL